MAEERGPGHMHTCLSLTNNGAQMVPNAPVRAHLSVRAGHAGDGGLPLMFFIFQQRELSKASKSDATSGILNSTNIQS